MSVSPDQLKEDFFYKSGSVVEKKSCKPNWALMTSVLCIYTPIKFMEFEQWMTSKLDRLDIRSLPAALKTVHFVQATGKFVSMHSLHFYLHCMIFYFDNMFRKIHAKVLNRTLTANSNIIYRGALFSWEKFCSYLYLYSFIFIKTLKIVQRMYVYKK